MMLNNYMKNYYKKSSKDNSNNKMDRVMVKINKVINNKISNKMVAVDRVVMVNNNVVAGVATGVSVAAVIGALMSQ